MNPGQQQTLLGFRRGSGERRRHSWFKKGYRKASLISLVLMAGFEFWTPLLILKG